MLIWQTQKQKAASKMAKASSKPLAAPPVERKVVEEEEITEKGGPKKRKTLRAKVEKVSAIAAVLTVRNLARTNPLLLEEQGEEHANRREIVHSHRHSSHGLRLCTRHL